ncbi:extracellular catalytic domain type 1 short-chain-length polyhydroxyalkanoate depolymerase [Thalassotalea agarivorans]|uniref:Esterase, PHB depolymerase family n=1 Tax=Thalassotalea agarivorans TaxID=349064 RepID=A0A1I0G1E9_THASX|nr:PHB depolymerase family esterase [Thalassotalea agarivorans]SET64495.1 esterase, PHB depolymerase family [Thalassotalea agarivorans]
MKWKTVKKAIALSGLAWGMTATANAGDWQQNVSLGGFNNVHIYTPDTQSTIGDGQALLIVLHGCTQSIDAYLNANLEDAAEAHGMVIAVPDAVNKAGFSCWSYWQGAINRNSGDYRNLVNLANAMSSDSNRNIDPDQVYIAGLSSGAAFAMQTACAAPDIFAGVAPSAGPSIGTSSSGAISTCETVTQTTFKNRCESYAGSYASHLDTQIAVIGHGTADTTVNTCYNQQNADGFANVYGVNQLPGSTTVSDDATRTASESLWQDNRVSMLFFDGLDHSWSGGAGASGSYVAGNSINFATYLGEYFAQHNKRVSRNQAPELSNLATSVSSSAITISGNAVDSEGSVAQVNITVTQVDVTPAVVVDTGSATTNASNQFSYTSAALPDALYSVTVSAIDNESKASDDITLTQRIGAPPANQPPQLSALSAAVSGQCATVTGTVVDVNQDLNTVNVAFANNVVSASVTGTTFMAEGCNLPGGLNQATVTATDTQQLSSSETITFDIDAGVTGDYNLHINEGHITWGVGYSACYLAFGTSDFTMREYDAGSGQCNWVADGEPSCAGPAQACTVTTPPTPVDSDNDGIADDSDNCPNNANADQADNDSDGIGNVCDATPDGETQITDSDNDGIEDALDNCPAIANANQVDTDNDGLGDVCDSTPNGEPLDSDNDGIEDALDNCPAIANASQADADSDGLGDACDSTPNGDFSCQETTASNYSHVVAGRATTSLGYVYSVGSNENMGLYNTFVTTTLAETSDGYYEIGTCN